MNSNKKLIILVVGFLTFSIFLVASYLEYGNLASEYRNKNIVSESGNSQNQ